jgi:hypothetical protein
VKLDNVMIGPTGDTILIDFCAVCTLEYVEMDIQKTERDLDRLKSQAHGYYLDELVVEYIEIFLLASEALELSSTSRTIG